MSARTKDFVVLAVDSKISGPLPGPFQVLAESIPANRKFLVLKGRACVLSGWLGLNFPLKELSTAIRSWDRQQPQSMPAAEWLRGILDVAGQVWRNLAYVHGKLPLDRHSGSLITSFHCAALVGGEPAIVRGRTVVGENDESIAAYLEPDYADLLYVSGDISTAMLTNIVANPIAPNYDLDPATSEGLRSIFRTDRVAQHAYNAEANAVIGAGSEAHLPSQQIPSTWNLTEVQRLFRPVFQIVEATVPDVAPPNNIYILGKNCIWVTTLESNDWNRCTARRTEQRHPSGKPRLR